MCNPPLNNSTSKQKTSACNHPGLKTVHKPCVGERSKPQIQDGGCHNALSGQGYHASHGAVRLRIDGGTKIIKRKSKMLEEETGAVPLRPVRIVTHDVTRE